VEYGLNYYRNQAISSYDRGEIPQGEHIVVGRPGATEVIQSLSKGRRVTDLAGFSPQHLEFYLVSGSP